MSGRRSGPFHAAEVSDDDEHEVYAYGVIAPSTLVELADPFPHEAGYAEIAGVYGSIGGEAAGGAFVLARLGVATKLSGTRLGADPESSRVIDALAAAGVDCSAIDRNADAPPQEIVMSSQEERTVFGTYGQMLADTAWNPPSLDDIRASRIVCLDPFFGDDSEQAARWCREAEVPFVTVDVPPDSPIARHASAVVVSAEFAGGRLGMTDVRAAFSEYRKHCTGLVVLTEGGTSFLYGRPEMAPREAAPFSVEARDTTGAGDSFRAGLIYGMLRGYGDDGAIRIAAAVSALVCERVPGVLGSPTEQDLRAFLAHRE